MKVPNLENSPFAQIRILNCIILHESIIAEKKNRIFLANIIINELAEKYCLHQNFPWFENGYASQDAQT